jgi:hypothetical protein
MDRLRQQGGQPHQEVRIELLELSKSTVVAGLSFVCGTVLVH